MSQNTRLVGEVEQLTLQCETLRAEKDQCNGEKEGRWLSWLYVLKQSCDVLFMLQA